MWYQRLTLEPGHSPVLGLCYPLKEHPLRAWPINTMETADHDDPRRQKQPHITDKKSGSYSKPLKGTSYQHYIQFRDRPMASKASAKGNQLEKR